MRTSPFRLLLLLLAGLLLVLAPACSEDEGSDSGNDDTTDEQASDDSEEEGENQEEEEETDEEGDEEDAGSNELRAAIESGMGVFGFSDDEIDCLVDELSDLPADQIAVLADPDGQPSDMDPDAWEETMGAFDSCVDVEAFASAIAELFSMGLPTLSDEAESCFAAEIEDIGGSGEIIGIMGEASDTNIPDEILAVMNTCIPPSEAALLLAQQGVDQGLITEDQVQCVADSIGEQVSLEQIIAGDMAASGVLADAVLAC